MKTKKKNILLFSDNVPFLSITHHNQKFFLNSKILNVEVTFFRQHTDLL